jgi:hypothetical protein
MHMIRESLTSLTRRALLASATFMAIAITLTGQAWASCFTTPQGKPLAPKAQYAAAAAAALAAADDESGSIVGLWNAHFLLANGDLYDESFQQFHSDGTEMMLSRGLPPPLGNVCVGVWKQNDRTYKLRHMAWTWDANGNYISIFVLEATLRVNRRGNRYTGSWTANNLSPLTGQPLPGEHFEGTVSGTRITAD